jgi:hypothetical protein
MSTIIPSHFDVTVAFPDGSTAKINLFQMGVMASAVKFRADHGVWPPSVGKLRLTRASICERFFIDPRYAKTYSMLAETLAECHASMMAEREAALAEVS